MYKVCDDCQKVYCYPLKIIAYKRGCFEYKNFCQLCIISKGYYMAEMKSFTFWDRGANFTGPGGTHYLTVEAMRFIIAMKWLIIDLDEAIELLIGHRERVTKTSCCVDIKTYLWKNKIVSGFCTKQARGNGKCVYVHVIDPLDLSAAPDTSPVGADSVGRAVGRQWIRAGHLPRGSGEIGPGPETSGLIQVDACVPALVPQEHGESVDSARKSYDGLLPSGK